MLARTNFSKRTASKTYTLKDIATARGANGSLPGGGVIAIGELSGGWVQSDIDAFVASNPGMSKFNIIDVSVDGTKNSQDPSQDASVEVALDIQAAVGQYFYETGKTPETIYVLWGKDINTVTEAFVNGPYDVLSWSWGIDEKDAGLNVVQAYAALSAKAVVNKQTITAASGDNSSSDGDPGANVDYPSSDANTLAVGGTSRVSVDVVWGTKGDDDAEGTGGGYSSYTSKPSWQTIAGSARMTPDVVDLADPNTGVLIYVNGSTMQIGGTSLASPLWAGRIAALGSKVGNIAPLLWSHPQIFTGITSGSNGQYDANPNGSPSPCTGLGVVNSQKLYAVYTGNTPAPTQGVFARLFGRIRDFLNSITI